MSMPTRRYRPIDNRPLVHKYVAGRTTPPTPEEAAHVLHLTVADVWEAIEHDHRLGTVKHGARTLIVLESEA